MRRTNTAALLLSLSTAALGCGELDDGVGATDRESVPLVNASTDLSSYPLEWPKVVRVIIPGGGCSGTVLRPRAVLTAGHCVTTTGVPNGPQRAANQISVNGVPATFIARSAVTSDSALLFFGADVVAQSAPHYTAIDPYDTSHYVGLWGPVMGWGVDGTPGSVAGTTLRQGLMTVSTASGNCFGGGWTGLCFQGGPAGGVDTAGGDSGGPFFGGQRPKGVVGVVSQTSRVFARAIDFRYDYRSAMFQRLNPNLDVDFSSSSQLSSFTAYQGRSGTAPVWAVSGGALVQKANAPLAYLIQTAAANGGDATFENVGLSTYLQSSDDDSMGLVLRYVDTADNYRCEANHALHALRIIARFSDEDVVIGSTPWNGTFDGSLMAATAEEQFLSCAFGGVNVFAVDTRLPIGQVGLYNHFNHLGKYLSFSSQQLEPDFNAWSN